MLPAPPPLPPLTALRVPSGGGGGGGGGSDRDARDAGAPAPQSPPRPDASAPLPPRHHHRALQAADSRQASSFRASALALRAREMELAAEHLRLRYHGHGGLTLQFVLFAFVGCVLVFVLTLVATSHSSEHGPGGLHGGSSAGGRGVHFAPAPLPSSLQTPQGVAAAVHYAPTPLPSSLQPPERPLVATASASAASPLAAPSGAPAGGAVPAPSGAPADGTLPAPSVAPAASALPATSGAPAGGAVPEDVSPEMRSPLLVDLLSAVDGAAPEEVLSAGFRALGGLLEHVPVRPACADSCHCPGADPAERPCGDSEEAGASERRHLPGLGGGDWPDALLVREPRSNGEAARRLEYWARCVTTARTRTGIREYEFGTFPAYQPNTLELGKSVPDPLRGAPPRAAALSSGYFRLKKLAFALHAATAPWWLTYPQVDAGHWAGPWLEDYVFQTLAQGVRKNVTRLEFDFERQLLGGGPSGVELVSDPSADAVGAEAEAVESWRMSDSGAGERTARPKRVEAAALFDALHESAGSPAAAIAAARAAGAPTVIVQYAFDFDLFYPWVPLFVPWERISAVFAYQLKGRLLVPPAMRANVDAQLRAVEQVLLPLLKGPQGRSVALVTVAQRAAGVLLPGASSTMLRLAAGILVLNAGGGGDAALPLLAHPWRGDEVEPLLPLAQHAHLISLAGMVHSGMRAHLVGEAYRLLGVGRFVQSYVEAPYGKSQHAHAAGETAHTPQETHWLTLSRRTALQLAPRGVNPTSFRLFEDLQLGLIPIYVFDDTDEQPWLPCEAQQRPSLTLLRARARSRLSPLTPCPIPSPRRAADHDFSGGLRDDGSLSRVSAAPRESGQVWHRTSIVLRMSEFNAFVTDALPTLVRNETWFEGKRAFIKSARASLFTYEAVTRQIYWWLKDPENADIKCQQPPRSFYGGRGNADQTWMQPAS